MLNHLGRDTCVLYCVSWEWQGRLRVFWVVQRPCSALWLRCAPKLPIFAVGAMQAALASLDAYDISNPSMSPISFRPPVTKGPHKDCTLAYGGWVYLRTIRRPDLPSLYKAAGLPSLQSFYNSACFKQCRPCKLQKTALSWTIEVQRRFCHVREDST